MGIILQTEGYQSTELLLNLLNLPFIWFSNAYIQVRNTCEMLHCNFSHYLCGFSSTDFTAEY